ncbi:hypothetical protein, partial [Snodgrassella communis]
KAVFDTRTYIQFYELLDKAAHGDLQAREAAGELLAAVLITKKPKLNVGKVSKAGKSTTGSFLEWNSWQNYQKTTVSGKQYAQIGNRLYSQHAVDRMQPSGLGAPAGTVGAGRNISPSIVEHTIQNGTKTTSTVNGVERTVHWSGDVGVVTESNGKIVVTILRRSEK